MRHKKIGKRLNLKSDHRRSLFKNLAYSLIKKEIVLTTLQKAKELKRFIEPIINLTKKNSIHNKRKVFSLMKDKGIVKKLFSEIRNRFMHTKGGYTRIIKSHFRKGDSANMAYIEILRRKKNKIKK
ncbi:50S ribosomal protein L17 [bacterium endosymbiont of Pedicinus badii]|uniref:50S ribosomal protein L17 n=1 Tax=bacterium endosymbiont of Pedicinus badii TaxID=1719126 RepID=UPI0009BB8ADE|nr:50S ribosomal protein L17 [bacterium endosymbiont of Pedicinus badii]OQM34123.1 50S ribosomal protein L17 [bacterium endosymbiont of Pedicinus badii]